MNEINTLDELVREVCEERTGGYDVEFDILPRRESFRADWAGFWLVVEVTSSRPTSLVNGQWWFDEDNDVTQVL